jgi:hypothetical protein
MECDGNISLSPIAPPSTYNDDFLQRPYGANNCVFLTSSNIIVENHYIHNANEEISIFTSVHNIARVPPYPKNKGTTQTWRKTTSS